MGKLQRDDENQTKCWIATGGHIWMQGYFDTLPPRVRQRLRSSPFNLCPACLVTEFLPRVVPGVQSAGGQQAALFTAIAIMEAEVRKRR
jgi:hypothetical protein